MRMIWASSPTRTIWQSTERDASAAPATIARGASSPPIASTAIVRVTTEFLGDVDIRVEECDEIIQVRLRLRRLRLEAGILVALFMAVGSAVAGAIASREMSNLAHQAALREGRAALDALAIPAAVTIATHDYTKLDNFVAELSRAQKGQLISLMVVDA